MVLNVAYSCNEGYLKHAMVSMLSLIDNNKEFESIHIYLICDNVSAESKDELMKVVNYDHVKVTLIDMNDIRGKIHTDGEFAISAFGRLFLGEFVSEERLIYLDCDSVINGSFIPLIQMNLDDAICGVVQDTVSDYYKTVLGNPADSRYFNSGFLVLNMKKWKELGMQEKALQVIEAFHGSVPHQDQGVLNKICYGKTKWLHPKYNLQGPMFEFTPKQLNKMTKNYYTQAEIEEAKTNPVFVHFTEGFSNRPWRENCTHPFTYLYRKYQAMTPYAGYLEKKSLNKHTQVVKWIYDNLPFSFYMAFCKCLEIRKRVSRR